MTVLVLLVLLVLMVLMVMLLRMRGGGRHVQREHGRARRGAEVEEVNAAVGGRAREDTGARGRPARVKERGAWQRGGGGGGEIWVGWVSGKGG